MVKKKIGSANTAQKLDSFPALHRYWFGALSPSRPCSFPCDGHLPSHFHVTSSFSPICLRSGDFSKSSLPLTSPAASKGWAQAEKRVSQYLPSRFSFSP